MPWAPLYWLSYSGSWANTDWYKEQYRDWTPNNTHNLSVSGGDSGLSSISQALFLIRQDY